MFLTSPRSVVLTVGLAVIAAGLAAAPAHAREQSYTTEHFALTWSGDDPGAGHPDPTDADHDGVPDAVARMGAAFEQARTFEIDRLGYQAPPTHGRLNLYVGTGSSAITRAIPGGRGRSRPSIIIIPPYILQSSVPNREMKSLAAHEYFHAIQNGYDSTEEHWIKEASSGWVEGLVAPRAQHNYTYLDAFVPFPHLGLATLGGLHEYGAFLFLQFLTERYSTTSDPNIVRELWEAMAVPEAIPSAPDDGPFEAIESALEKRGTTLTDAWQDFLLWRWQLRRFALGEDYVRQVGGQWRPTMPSTTVSTETCRLTPDTSDGSLPALSGEYARFLPSTSATKSARLAVLGPAGTTGFALIKSAQGPSTVTDLAFGPDGLASLVFPFGGDGATRVMLGAGPSSPVDNPTPLAYSVRIESASAVTPGAPSGPTSTTYGVAVPLSGRVSCNGNPAPFAHAVLIETEVASGASRSIDLITDAFGNWSYLAAPQVNSTYSVEVVDPLLSRASSTPATVGVRVVVNLTLSADQIDAGGSVTVGGNVVPVHQMPVLIEIRRVDGPWQTAAQTTVDASGNYSTDITFPATGAWEVRARMPETGDADHLPGDSPPKLVQVGES